MSKIDILSISLKIAPRWNWWLVNISFLGNGLVPSGNEPFLEPMLTKFCAVSTACSSWSQRKHQNSALLALWCALLYGAENDCVVFCQGNPCLCSSSVIPWFNGNTSLIASEMKCVLLNVLFTLVMELVSYDMTSSVLKLVRYCSIVTQSVFTGYLILNTFRTD